MLSYFFFSQVILVESRDQSLLFCHNAHLICTMFPNAHSFVMAKHDSACERLDHDMATRRYFGTVITLACPEHLY